MTKPVLEPGARAFADATASPPYLFDLETHAAEAAIRQAIAFLSTVLKFR
ncbi:hypothetical protein [Actinophytocola xanthii]|nr:hypothetical protein [Actinophytocola xanthii]